MGKIEKGIYCQAIADSFHKTSVELFLEKSCNSHVFWAHCSFVLVAMETIIYKKKKKNGKRKHIKNDLLRHHMLYDLIEIFII